MNAAGARGADLCDPFSPPPAATGSGAGCRPEAHSAASAAIRRAVLAARGETLEFRGRHIDPRYRFSNPTLIEWLEITPAEERRLTTIIGRDEKRRRDRLRDERRRRDGGAVERAEYEAKARERREQARALHRLSHTHSEIAAALGVSDRWVREMLRDRPE